ncbi:MAG: DUF429 domain-containing protein [Opitutales bacterium]
MRATATAGTRPPAKRYVLGVDGCRMGWVALWQTLERSPKVGGAVYASLEALWKAHGDAQRILIDMPIGLPAETSRACDVEARRILGRGLGSRVFPCPARVTVEQEPLDYVRACQINYTQTGRKLSKQSFFILPKIAECDQLLRTSAAARRTLVEAHPEVCFAGLHGGAGIRAGKKTPEGFSLRMRYLNPLLPGLKRLQRELRGAYPKSKVEDDDILDAAVLAHVARVPQSWRVLPQGDVPRDARGLPMRIVGLDTKIAD